MSSFYSLGSEASFKAILQESMQLDSLQFASRELLYVTASPESRSGVVGPHYAKRKTSVLPKLPKGFSVPYTTNEQGEDPFPNGISRFAPWELNKENERKIQGSLKGDFKWQETPLKYLEGQQFQMAATAYAEDNKLHWRYAVVSEGDSLTGMQLSFHLNEGSHNEISCQAKEVKNHFLKTTFCEDIDIFLHPFPSERQFILDFSLADIKFRIFSETISSEHAVRISYKMGNPFFTVAFLSAKNPLYPNLSVSQLWMSLEPLM